MTEQDIIVRLNNIAAKYGYGKGTDPFTNDEWNTICHAKGIIKHLIAENKRLKEEAAEQESIAAHEHATQMEWFSIACDYKAENAELREKLSNSIDTEQIAKYLAERFDCPCNISPIDEEMYEFCEECNSDESKVCWEKVIARLKEIKEEI